MFDIGWIELLLIGVVALIVIEPKDLPLVMRAMGGWIQQLKSLIRDFTSLIDEAAQQEEVKRAKERLRNIGNADVPFEEPRSKAAKTPDMSEEKKQP